MSANILHHVTTISWHALLVIILGALYNFNNGCILKKWTEQRLQMGDQWHNTDRLFTKWDGTPMHPDSLTSWFHDFITRSGLPDISIHSLRHTNATLQIAGGVPISTVANRLGHANSATTGRIYIHAIQSADQAAADTLENLLNPLNKSKIG